MENSLLFRAPGVGDPEKPTVAILNVLLGPDKPANLIYDILVDCETPYRVAIGIFR